MPHTTSIVDRIIESDGAIRKDLGRGLLNIRALARYIQGEARLDGEELSIEAVIGAIRRYDVGARVALHEKRASSSRS